jgi:hypothetical protein
MATATLDAVTRYATDVVAGRTIAARLVRLACERHLNDLRDAAAKGLLWKPEDAQEAIDFFAECLCLPEETDADEDVEASPDVMPEQGTPFVLTPFQQFIVGSLFGWFAIHVSKTTGARRVQQRFRIAYFEGAKGCGKTPMGAGILIYMLVRHGVRGAQLFCAAVTKDQAKIAFADCVKMVGASPALQQLIKVQGNNLSVKTTGSFIRPISSEKRGLDGKRVHGACRRRAPRAPERARVVEDARRHEGPAERARVHHHEQRLRSSSRCAGGITSTRARCSKGSIVNEAWFAFVCHLDACERCPRPASCSRPTTARIATTGRPKGRTG